ncbi:18495_t:CDS:2 [Rhizophagus irregularis]|nr:18495_t:CDS:2 [Rhizophagus irregularis]
MIFSLNCLFLGEASIRSISVDISDEIIVGNNRIKYEVSHVKSLILSEKGISYSPDNLNLWKVDRVTTTLVAVLSSQQPISPFRRVFDHKFYDREQAINQIAMIANMNYTNRLLTYHRSHYFILVPGGSGIGKSRVGMETQHLISYAEESALMNIGRINLVKDSLNDPCYIFINFNDGCKYLQKLDKMRVRIGARIAVASGIALTS